MTSETNLYPLVNEIKQFYLQELEWVNLERSTRRLSEL